jgi:phytoene dehydrogenase-like protein
MKSIGATFDVIILGGGHNGLVAAAYLSRAGLRVLVLEKNEDLGGAATSKRVFPDYDARLSRYAYLVSLFPEMIIRDLGLRLELRTRATASYTPYQRNGKHSGLLLSIVSEELGRRSVIDLTGSEFEFDRLSRFYRISRIFAEKLWETMLQPLRSKEELGQLFAGDDLERQVWRSIVEEPLGSLVESCLQDDLVRGLVFTDAKIGLLTHPFDPTLLQNRCFIYHVIGNRTGEWKVPVGGMGFITDELIRVASSFGVQLLTGVRVRRLDFSGRMRTVQFEVEGQTQTVDGRFLLVNAGKNVLAQLQDQSFKSDPTDEGSVFKINMLLNRLPRLLSPKHSAQQSFCGTFHINEGYEQMKTSYLLAAQGQVPDKIPCEVYCHTLTDDSILSSELRGRGFHTLTLFALDTPWQLFAADPVTMRERVVRRCLDGLNEWLAEPIEDCLARGQNDEPCLEAKSPVDIEQELGLYHGNIFQRALSFPFAETPAEVGTWGVETEHENVFLCGSSARRGGGVSGIPGHNAAMKVLESLGRHPAI